MPSTIPVFSLRVQETTLNKVRTIAAKNKRSLNKEIEYVLDQYVASYEQAHGEIKLPED